MNLPDRFGGPEIALRGATPLAVEFAPETAGDRLDLRSLISMLRRRLLLILGFIVLGASVAMLITARSPKLYTSSADVMLDRRAEQITPGSAPVDDQPQRAEEIETELQLIRSHDLAGKVFDELRLGRDRGFVGGLPAKRENGIAKLTRALDAKRVGTAYALRISYTDGDPVRAAWIANAYARLYTDDQVAKKVVANRKAIGILQSRMDELRQQAQSDFGALQQYRIRNDLQSESGTSLTEQEISAYNQQVAIARAEASQARARLGTARGGGGDSTSSPVVTSLRGQRAALSARVVELSNRYLGSHPELVAAREQLADIDAQIDVEVRRAVDALAADANAAEQRLASLSGSLGNATGRLSNNNAALVAMDDLERRAQASQALYESYLNRYKEAVARSGAEQPDSTLLSPASVPVRPSSPNLPLNLSLGLLIGALLGVSGAVVTEGAYSGLTTADDVERRLGVRCLGSVPLLKSIAPHAGSALATIDAHPGGLFAESLRSLLASVRQSNNSRNQVIAITSAFPEEGKTTVASCLARTAAMAGERVIVIDCDVVRRKLSGMLGSAGGKPGLRELLEGRATIEEAVLGDRLGGADVLAITTPFERGERLLEQGKLHRLIAKLRERYDLVVLDCAPILPIAETREIVGLADNAVIVARWRDTSDSALRAALKMLPLRTLGDLGIVLNVVDMRKRMRFGGGDPGVFYKKYRGYYS